MGREVVAAGGQTRTIVLSALAAAALVTGCLAGSSSLEVQRRHLEDEVALLPSVESVRQVKASWESKMAASSPEAWDAALLASSVSSAPPSVAAHCTQFLPG
jgi:hypothetical protein